MHRSIRFLVLAMTAVLILTGSIFASSSNAHLSGRVQTAASDESDQKHGNGTRTYAVTVTNLTRSQIMSPPVVISHKDTVRLFTLGQAASPELALLAQDGDASDLITKMWSNADVQDVNQADGGIMPGLSATVVIEIQGNRRHISLASMLVSTNDAFVAVSGVRVPSRSGSMMTALAYDAGSEENNEDCAYIPGPPCGNPYMDSDVAGEGYIHVHGGIHGGASLDPAMHDWRNPVASVSIERID